MLVAFAVRVATVRAIRAVMWPEFAVVDSPENPLALLERGKPLIAVYTSHSNEGLEGNELLAGDPRVALTIQIFLPSQVTVTVAGKPLTIDTSVEGAQTILDVIAKRILAAFPTQAEPWSCLWGELVQKTARLEDAAYLVESNTLRTAARELTLDCETLYEPIPGAAPTGVWERLVALMRAEPATHARSLAHLADWLSAEISGPQLLTQDERDRIDLGLSAYAAAAASILPIVRVSEIGEVAVTVEGSGGDQVVVPGPAGTGGP